MPPEFPEKQRIRLQELAFIVTDDCNFSCSYCHQKKERQYLSIETLDRAVDFFYPLLARPGNVVFYGGEPLLAFELIRHGVARFIEKNKQAGLEFLPGGERPQRFCLTTNGSLLDEGVLSFLNDFHFNLLLSFDNLTQEVNRAPGTLRSTRGLLEKLLAGVYPDLTFATNTVFPPGSVSLLAPSLIGLVEMGVADIAFDLDRCVVWDEGALQVLDSQLQVLGEFLLAHYRTTGRIPVQAFRPGDTTARNQNISFCNGGLERLAVSPRNRVWGCVQFHDYLKDMEGDADFSDYSFGTLDQFIASSGELYTRVLENYAGLRMDNYFTSEQRCYLCPDLEFCVVCPVNLARVTGFIGQLPTWYCSMARIRRARRAEFLAALDREKPSITPLSGFSG